MDWMDIMVIVFATITTPAIVWEAVTTRRR
jgi:hypothetical protein